MTSTIGTAPAPRTFTYCPVDPAAVAAGYRYLADLIESGQAPIPLAPAVGLVVHDEAQAAELRGAFGDGQQWRHEEHHGSLGSVYLIFRGMCGGLPIEQWLALHPTTTEAVAR